MDASPARSPRSAARSAVIAACCALALSACGGDAEPSPGPTPPSGAVEAELVALDELSEAVESALADASSRFGVATDEIAVAGALRVTWSDGSLGCPEPDTMYTQALVPGYQLVLEVAGARVTYHGADGELPFLCER